MLVYSFADKEDKQLLNDMFMTEDYQELLGYNIRFALVYVTNEDNNGITSPVFKNLPYKVKYNNTKDRLLKNVDVEIHLDNSYWFNLSDEEKIAILDGALHQITIVEKKGIADYNDDGTVKIRLKKPDMTYEGFSEIAEKHGSNSAEIRNYRQLNSEFEGILI